ncbi:MAG: hypothetical protein CMD02_05905 [Flavobacteriales bacterium]|nr:hypothetical protein [Flavobacteriales bacterium]|tara:strand:+ start:775 stop:1158 length:384 start_codon:yes stop_codon:yes gene_type:complete
MSLIKYTLEFPIKTSVSILFKRLSTPSGLSEWFADNVNIKNDVLTFFWEGSEEEAIVIKKKKDVYIQYQWLEDKGEEKYFEFLIQVDEITKDISLIITDFAYDNNDKEDGIQLWNKQIENLKNAIGI